MTHKGATYELLWGKEEGALMSKRQGIVVKAGLFLQIALKYLCPSAEYQVKVIDPTTGKTMRADMIFLGWACELKLGFNFDTKKSSKEVEEIKKYANLISSLRHKDIRPAICLFQADGIKDLHEFKTDTSGVRMMTGRELCNEIGIKYQDVLVSIQTAAREDESRDK